MEKLISKFKHRHDNEGTHTKLSCRNAFPEIFDWVMNCYPHHTTKNIFHKHENIVLFYCSLIQDGCYNLLRLLLFLNHKKWPNNVSAHSFWAVVTTSQDNYKCIASQHQQLVRTCGKAENDEAKSGNGEAKGVPGWRGVMEGDGRWWNDVTEVWWGREVLESVRKTENGG